VFRLLSVAQLAVLRWVADGEPNGVYDEGFGHRITARALERRGLVKVRGHGRSWTAALTAGGRYYLEHGSYEPGQQGELARSATSHRRTERGNATAPVPLPVDGLVDYLRAVGGILAIDTPSDVDRVSYRRAVEQARVGRGLAFNERVEITGTKHGPLVIELVQITGAGAVVPVPIEANAQHPAVQAAATRLSSVSDAQQARGLTLVEAIANECAQRGWQIAFDDEPGFAISIDQETYRCLLSEEREKRDVYPDAAVAERKYDWQRVSPEGVEIYSGRLRLEIGQGQRSRSWSDRKRRTLASKLSEFFDALDELSSVARDKRARLEQAHRQNVAAWERAVPLAREQYVHALNVKRAKAQIAAWQHANDLRRYADAVASAVEGESDNSRKRQLREWVTRLNEEATRIDPLTDESQLCVESPDEISGPDLDKYMPNGWTSRRPPDPPAWLPS